MDVFSSSAIQTETRRGFVVPKADVCCLETAEFINKHLHRTLPFRYRLRYLEKTLPTPHEIKLTTLNATALEEYPTFHNEMAHDGGKMNKELNALCNFLKVSM